MIQPLRRQTAVERDMFGYYLQAQAGRLYVEESEARQLVEKLVCELSDKDLELIGMAVQDVIETRREHGARRG